MDGALEGLLSRTVELTVRKKALVEEFRVLTAGQSKLLVPDKAEELLALIEKKQACINEINSIEAELKRHEEGIVNTAGLPSRKELKKIYNGKWEVIGKLQGEIIFILREVQRLDEQNRRQLGDEHRKLKKSMASLRARKGSAIAYQGSTAPSGGYFVDQKK